MIKRFYAIFLLLFIVNISSSVFGSTYHYRHRLWSDGWAIGTGTSNHLWSAGENWYRPENNTEGQKPICETDVRIGTGEGRFSYPQALADHWQDIVEPTCNSPESAAIVYVCSPVSSGVNDPNDHKRLWITSGADLHIYGQLRINGCRYNQQGTINMDGGTLNIEESLYLAVHEVIGTFNMTGGTVLIQRNFYCPKYNRPGSNEAYLNLDGGLFLVEEVFCITNNSDCIGEIDISGGTIKILGDRTTLIESYIGDGYIKAHGVTDGGLISGNLRAFLKLDYNIRTTGYTTLSATTIPDDKAWRPIPNPITDVSQTPLATALTWSGGEGVSSHDIYIGTDYTVVNNATHASSEFVKNTTSNSYSKPGDFSPGVTYYWRIDEIGASTVKGYVWNFTADSCQAYDKSPRGYDYVTTDPNLTWASGSYAQSHDIYFGTSYASVNAASRLAGDIDGDTLVDGGDLKII